MDPRYLGRSVEYGRSALLVAAEAVLQIARHSWLPFYLIARRYLARKLTPQAAICFLVIGW
jgi:hypothetical protein